MSTFKTKSIVHINTFNIYNVLLKKYFTWIPVAVVVIVMCLGISCLFCEWYEHFFLSLFSHLRVASGGKFFIPF